MLFDYRNYMEVHATIISSTYTLVHKSTYMQYTQTHTHREILREFAGPEINLI